MDIQVTSTQTDRDQTESIFKDLQKVIHFQHLHRDRIHDALAQAYAQGKADITSIIHIPPLR